METFLVAVHHGLPIEPAFIVDAATVGQLREVDLREERFQVREEVVEARRFVGDGGEEEAGLR